MTQLTISKPYTIADQPKLQSAKAAMGTNAAFDMQLMHAMIGAAIVVTQRDKCMHCPQPVIRTPRGKAVHAESSGLIQNNNTDCDAAVTKRAVMHTSMHE